MWRMCVRNVAKVRGEMDQNLIGKGTFLEAKTTMDLLDEIAPGTAVVNTDQIAAALGKSGTGGPQTIRNQIASKKFPLHAKLRKNGAHWILSKAVFAAWMDGEDVVTPATVTPAKRGRGRPRKTVEHWLVALDESWNKLLQDGRRMLDEDPNVRVGATPPERTKI